ncbi:hemerythrin domain-containing protein [Jatrophihabitans sp. YIM 134969]
MTRRPELASRPADTTMMGVVHDALRRDLRRLQAVLAAPVESDVRRVAVADHALWIMDFLHHHHEGEDSGLWPVVRSRSATGAEVLDRMEADHAVVVPRMAEVERAAAAYRRSADAQEDLLGAVDALAESLLPHLRAEEDEAMPLVSETLSAADWSSWDQRTNVKGKSLPVLAIQGHFLADRLDPERYDLLIHLIPAVPRFVVLKGFARTYRRARAARWGSEVPCGPA